MEGRLANLTLERCKASTLASAQLQVHCAPLTTSDSLFVAAGDSQPADVCVFGECACLVLPSASASRFGAERVLVGAG